MFDRRLRLRLSPVQKSRTRHCSSIKLAIAQYCEWTGPKTRVVLYREEDGSCPFVEWFNELPAKVQDKCYLRLQRLGEMGHELRRPEADFLRDGIRELRVSLRGGITGSSTSFTGRSRRWSRMGAGERAGGPAERDRPRRIAQEAVRGRSAEAHL
ncbi:MAG TPA: type II toxin-antitoxin system RelE/ParE family toxin [Verrucomicrobiae bacterium]|nr:type II toxin-antitoxin system RelE/ParE family toxin [Verrucomicrobiae bacterium]